MTFPTLFHSEPAQFLALDRYEVACRAVAEAKAVDDVMDVVARADAWRVYARQAKNRQMEIDAVEIRLRAERKLGELMAAQKVATGLATGNQHSRPLGIPKTPSARPSLAEAGIDKNLAKRARSYAAVPEEKFEQLLTDKRQNDNRRVALDPDAEAAARDGARKRYERIAQSSAGAARAEALAAENARLVQQVEQLGRRVTEFIAAYDALEEREALWKERALALGWRDPPA